MFLKTMFSGRAAPPRRLVLLLVAWGAACGDASRALDGASASTAAAGDAAVSAVDDAGRTVTLPRPARRVVSLLPAGTQTLFALGAGDRVVGRTRYDTDPHVQDLPSVGGGLDPSLERLVSLQPDLVVAWEPPGGSRVRRQLERMGVPVFAISTRDTADIFRNIRNLGRLTARDASADSLARRLRSEIAAVSSSVPAAPRPSVAYVVSLDPPMIAGTHNFIAELLEVAGADPLEIGGSERGLSPQVSLEALLEADPDILMLPTSRDGSDLVAQLRAAPGWRDLRAVREGRVVTVPADLANRPGPRIPEIARMLRDSIAAVW